MPVFVSRISAPDEHIFCNPRACLVVDGTLIATFSQGLGFTFPLGDRLPNSRIHILLVDDFEPYRTVITSLLAGHPRFQVICEASDGLGAEEKAKQLAPDLILMDIGLPKLNGLEAARRIRELLPTSKIVFLTQETDADVVREALNLGAVGYVVRQRTSSDLLPALAAVLQGKRFVSAGLDGNEFAPVNDRHHPH